MGTRTETEAAVAALQAVLDVREASAWRGDRRLGRVYLDVTTPDSGRGGIADSASPQTGERGPARG